MIIWFTWMSRQIIVYATKPLDLSVLRKRLHHAQDDGQRALQVQIPLVLSRRVQDLHQNCRRSHLQVDNTQAKRH